MKVFIFEHFPVPQSSQVSLSYMYALGKQIMSMGKYPSIFLLQLEAEFGYTLTMYSTEWSGVKQF